MLILGQVRPPGMVGGSGSDSTVHGQPVLSAGGGGSWESRVIIESIKISGSIVCVQHALIKLYVLGRDNRLCKAFDGLISSSRRDCCVARFV